MMHNPHSGCGTKILFRLLLLLLLQRTVLPAGAGAIRLDFTAASQFSQSSVLLKMQMVNNGDESAHDIHVAAFFGDIHVESETLASLSAGAEHEWSLDLGAPPRPAGIHIIVLRVHYTDAFGHPVSVLHTTEVFTADVEPTAPFTVELAWSEIRKTGTVPMTITENSGRRQEVRCRLILPEELQCEAPEIVLQLEPHGVASHDFRIENTTALRDSRYRVYAIIDFIRDGKHVSIQQPALLSVHPYWMLSVRARYGWMALALVLLLAFVVAQRLPRVRGSVLL